MENYCRVCLSCSKAFLWNVLQRYHLVVIWTMLACNFFGNVEGSTSVTAHKVDFTLKYDNASNKIEPEQQEDRRIKFSHQWAAHILGGVKKAKELAEKHGFIYLGEILPNYYHLRHKRIARRSIRPSPHAHRRMAQDESVRWMEQQVIKRRVKRDGSRWKSKKHHSKRNNNRDKFHFNDAKWRDMWYLQESSRMNVSWAWRRNITGRGVVVTIMDDGLERQHPDIADNYDAKASFDFNDNEHDPSPRYDINSDNKHGTRCAGEVAAKENNGECIVGIAYGANVGGIRMLDGDVTDAVEASSLGHAPNHVDIYSASWGPDDDGKTLDGPAHMASLAFEYGVKEGRHGLGSIYIWASGNGGKADDDCNCDGYANSIYTISISAASEKRQVPWYSESCASTLATTYSSGGQYDSQIITTDINRGCTNEHTGTSASAPLAAGMCALALQANPRLTWRDMQYLIVYSSNHDLLVTEDVQRNGVGRLVSHAFGYGLMNAAAMIPLAMRWTTVPEQKRCEVTFKGKRVIGRQPTSVHLMTDACKNQPEKRVRYLEHVQVRLTMSSSKRGDLSIYLVSPMGTRSQMLSPRPQDVSRGTAFNEWVFMSVHHWGESAAGKWSLQLYNGDSSDTQQQQANLTSWALILHGVQRDPQPSFPSSFALKEHRSHSYPVKEKPLYPHREQSHRPSNPRPDPLGWMGPDQRKFITNTAKPSVPPASPKVSIYYCGSKPHESTVPRALAEEEGSKVKSEAPSVISTDVKSDSQSIAPAPSPSLPPSASAPEAPLASLSPSVPPPHVQAAAPSSHNTGQIEEASILLYGVSSPPRKEQQIEEEPAKAASEENKDANANSRTSASFLILFFLMLLKFLV